MPEPVTIFCPKSDPAEVIRIVRQVAPGAQVIGGDGADWQQIIIPGRRRLLTSDPPLALSNDPSHYAQPNWNTQMHGFTAFLLRWPRNDHTKDVMSLITALRFAVAVSPDHLLDLSDPSSDARVPVALSLAKRLEAILFTPSALWDGDGKVIMSADGSFDRDAVVPNVPAATIDPATGRPGVRLPADAYFGLLGPNTEPQEGDADPLPPHPERVARRALALAAVAGRALLEQEDPADPSVEETRGRIVEWVNAIGIREELEPDESQILQLPIGRPDRQDAVNATWRIEGLTVLAWALQRFELPPHDEPVDPGKLLPAVGILNADRARALIAEPPLRPHKELLAMQTRLLAIHWRLRNFGLDPRAMNFREFCDGRTHWLGKVDLTGIRLIDDDLALHDQPIARASEGLVRSANSAVMERHLAINWLCGGTEVYSETDTPT